MAPLLPFSFFFLAFLAVFPLLSPKKIWVLLCLSCASFFILHTLSENGFSNQCECTNMQSFGWVCLFSLYVRFVFLPPSSLFFSLLKMLSFVYMHVRVYVCVSVSLSMPMYLRERLVKWERKTFLPPPFLLPGWRHRRGKTPVA